MAPNSPITQTTIDDIRLLLRLIDNLQFTRKRFVRNLHGPKCDCFEKIPTVEEIEILRRQIKAVRELAIYTFKLQLYGRLPTMCQLLRTKIGNTILKVECLQGAFVRQAVAHDITSTFEVKVNKYKFINNN